MLIFSSSKLAIFSALFLVSTRARPQNWAPVFAAGISAYIFIGLYFEEQDLIKEFGDTYLDYMQRVKRVVPFIV